MWPLPACDIGNSYAPFLKGMTAHLELKYIYTGHILCTYTSLEKSNFLP